MQCHEECIDKMVYQGATRSLGWCHLSKEVQTITNLRDKWTVGCDFLVFTERREEGGRRGQISPFPRNGYATGGEVVHSCYSG